MYVPTYLEHKEERHHATRTCQIRKLISDVCKRSEVWGARPEIALQIVFVGPGPLLMGRWETAESCGAYSVCLMSTG
jgi:hypothetical protein